MEHTWRGQAHEDVGTFDHVGQRARVGLAGVARHVGGHVGVPSGMDHATYVGQRHVFRRQAHRHQQVDAGDRGGTRAGGNEAYVGQLLVLQNERVAHRGGHRDGGAVLVVMEHRNAHARAQALFDDEAFRRLDVFQVDGAERRLECRHNVDEQLRVGRVHLDVEHVDAGEFLEQRGLALHHWLAGQRAYVAQAQHGGAVADDGHQVGARGERARLLGVCHNGAAGGSHARGVGQRQVALRGHALGGFDGDLSGARVPVVVERGLAEIFVHWAGACCAV